jgi:hypothetical protein
MGNEPPWSCVDAVGDFPAFSDAGVEPASRRSYGGTGLTGTIAAGAACNARCAGAGHAGPPLS